MCQMNIHSAMQLTRTGKWEMIGSCSLHLASGSGSGRFSHWIHIKFMSLFSQQLHDMLNL